MRTQLLIAALLLTGYTSFTNIRGRYAAALAAEDVRQIRRLAGYGALDPDTLRGTNPDKYLCIAVLVLMPFFAFGAVSIFGASHTTLPRPSWRRVTFSWWRDPLQSLFISTYAVGGMALGAALHLRSTTSTGFWMFMVFVCMFIGLILGQVFAYAYHRARITQA